MHTEGHRLATGHAALSDQHLQAARQLGGIHPDVLAARMAATGKLSQFELFVEALVRSSRISRVWTRRPGLGGGHLWLHLGVGGDGHQSPVQPCRLRYPTLLTPNDADRPSASSAHGTAWVCASARCCSVRLLQGFRRHRGGPPVHLSLSASWPLQGYPYASGQDVCHYHPIDPMYIGLCGRAGLRFRLVRGAPWWCAESTGDER